ncbi:MAG: cobalamin-binding protein [Acidimicrobiales bacterium]
MRIVSLVPAATEIVWALGVGDRLVGRSHECDYPAEATTRPAVTRSVVDPEADAADIDRTVRELASEGRPVYEVDAGLLGELGPDLVITQGACDVCAVPDSIARQVAADVVPKAEVLSLSPVRLADVAGDIQRVGRACAVTEAADRLQQELARRFEAAAVPVPSPLRVALLEWLDPPMLAGHWTPEVVAAAGCIASGPPAGAASVTAAWEQVDDLEADAIVVAPCGFDLARTRREAGAHYDRLWGAAPRVLLADGNAYFNRPGPRLVVGTEAIAAWLNGRPLPEGFEPLEDWL